MQNKAESNAFRVRDRDPFAVRLLMKTKKAIDVFVRLSGPFFVLLASGLITIVVVLHFRIIIPYYGDPLRTNFGLFNTLLSVYIAGNLAYNYYMIVFTPPGYATESNTIPQPEFEEEGPRKGEGFSRFCKTCKRSKPERSHHCHVCKKCVLRMDHHCPWVSNCVGFYNHKYFILFLVYLWAGCFYVAVLTFAPFQNSTLGHEPYDGKGITFKGTVLFIFVITISITLALSFMLLWQLYLVLTGQTTIEFYYNRFKMGQARVRGEVWENEYNLGVRKNFQLFFGVVGRPWFAWLLPSSRAPPGNGSDYLKRVDNRYV